MAAPSRRLSDWEAHAPVSGRFGKIRDVGVPEIANLLLSGSALGISGVALRIAQKQVGLDERSLFLAEQQTLLDAQE